MIRWKKEVTFKVMATGFSAPPEQVPPSELSLCEVRGPAIYVPTSSVLAGGCLWKGKPWTRPFLGLEQSSCEPYCLCPNHCPLVSGAKLYRDNTETRRGCVPVKPYVLKQAAPVSHSLLTPGIE